MKPDGPQHRPLVVDLGGEVSMTFRHIPAGFFRMGQRGGEPDEQPVTEREVDEFWMGETPVTQAQYRVLAQGCLKALREIEGNEGVEPSSFKDRPDAAQRPVENVNWHEARVVAGWLAKRMQAAGILPPGWVVDLPSEARWEYACRAGNKTDYWSGDGEATLAEVGWYTGNAGGETHAVGVLRANAWGLHDLHGNVSEWCLDLYESTRSRLTVPGADPDAYVDRHSLRRDSLNPAHQAWATLFARICEGHYEVVDLDLKWLAQLLDLAQRLDQSGSLGWGDVGSVCKRALKIRRWPEDQHDLAGQLHGVFQQRVDASSDSAEPDRVVRGGSWGFAPGWCRSAYRLGWLPGDRSDGVGFRVCLAPGPAEPPATKTDGAEAKPGAETEEAASRRSRERPAQPEPAAEWDAARLPRRV